MPSSESSNNRAASGYVISATEAGVLADRQPRGEGADGQIIQVLAEIRSWFQGQS